MDEILPTPQLSTADPHLIRRTGSLAVIIIFLTTALYLSLSDDVGYGLTAVRLKHLFGEGQLDDSGGPGWIADDVRMSSGEKEMGVKVKTDFERYVGVRTLAGDEVDVTKRRLIFVGDVHGSYGPLL